MEAINIGQKLLRKKEAKAQCARMGIEDVDAAFNSRASSCTGQEGLVDERSRWMQRDPRDGNAAWDFGEFG